MFNPKTDRIRMLAKLFPELIIELNRIFSTSTNIYIDWQNVIHWQNKLGFHIHFVRLKQFLDSFDSIRAVNIYTGTSESSKESIKQISELRSSGYTLSTKAVKLIRISIDTSNTSTNSTVILSNFIKKNFISIMDSASIEHLNGRLTKLNREGVLYIEERKCNFDVEISRDMQRDFENGITKNYILWSTDSDFADLIIQIEKGGGKVYIFAMSGCISFELNQTTVTIFDIRKIREFICWPKEISKEIKDIINRL